MIVFGFDPLDNNDENEMDMNFCPFAELNDLFDTELEMLYSPDKPKLSNKNENDLPKLSIRVVNCFQKSSKKQSDIDLDNCTQIGDISANDHTHNLSEIGAPKDFSFKMSTSKDVKNKQSKLLLKEASENEFDENSLKFVLENVTGPDLGEEIFLNTDDKKVFQNQQKYNNNLTKLKSESQQKTMNLPGRKRKRKVIRQRDHYRKRKDVLLKSTLRKCRKHYLEAYTNFRRTKFLDCPRIEDFNNTDIYPSDLEHENYHLLNYDSLAAFRNEIFPADNPESQDLAYYIGAMISPQEFKTKLIENEIKIEPIQKNDEFIRSSDLIYEVLYKFSYQKLSKF